MFRYILFILLLFITFFSSCRADFETVPSAGQLLFSKDTVYLDTTFTRISTNTYTLKVYNPTAKDVTIPIISLEKPDSYYRILVDGKSGKSISNTTLLAKDSLFIFIETTIDFKQLVATQNEFLYTDRLLFDVGAQQQDVDLVTLVKDAVFLYPEKNNDGSIKTIVLDTDEKGTENRTEGFELSDDQLLWTNEKPYVIYGYAVVPQNKSLVINPGARIHFHDKSGLLVSDGASIQANGKISKTEKLENEIIFEGDKLQELYRYVSGQWGAIWLKKNSINNIFTNTTIKNGTIGIKSESIGLLSLILTSCQILNHSNYGLQAINSSVEATNSVFHNAGVSTVHLLGGQYRFKHNTITNYWEAGYRQGKALYVSNIFKNKIINLSSQFDNCIIYGSRSIELELQKEGDGAFSYQFNHCLIRFNDVSKEFTDNPLYDFNNVTIMKNIIRNEDPEFKNTVKNILQIGLKSKAINAADQNVANIVPQDILGKSRTTSAAIGAYQPTDFSE